jgi:hypothetical protein
LGSFHAWLADQRLKESRTRKGTFGGSYSDGKNTILWIEHLLNIPIPDYRKLAIWRILVPYLLNIRGLSPDKAQGIVREWLVGCNKIRRLDFNPNHRIKSALNSSKDFLPIGLDKLRAENEGFYNLLQDDGVLTK